MEREKKIFIMTGRSGYVIGHGGVAVWWYLVGAIIRWDDASKVSKCLCTAFSAWRKGGSLST